MAKNWDPRILLQNELERRCQDNPRYSLRAFAKALGMSPTGLSFVLTGKRPLSKQKTAELSERLALDPVEVSRLMHTEGASEFNRVNRQLELDSFSVISDWYHYGILSLLEISDSPQRPKDIARALGITEAEVRAAWERLTRLDLLEKTEMGRFRQKSGPLRIASMNPTAASKRFQRQLLMKAIEAMENEPDDQKDLSSMTFALDPSLLPLARERIREFRRSLVQELEAKGNPSRVYSLTVQIFPMSRSLKSKKIRNKKRKVENG